jgi:PAS domain S-box-containing protein
MKFDFSPWRSVKTRVTLFTLAVFLASIWSLSFFAARELRADLEALLGEKQRSTVALLGAQIRDEMEDRFAALGALAGEAGRGAPADAVALQALLERSPFTQRFFNGGILILGADGTALADVPRALGRTGINYRDVDTVAAALVHGKSTVGRPLVGRVLKAPVFGMTVPIRNASGAVVGAVYGVTNLGKPNFLDKITDTRYGTTGGFFIASPKWRLNITATDKSRIMQPLPPAGVNPAMDRFVEGFEGTQVLRNPAGREVLASVKHLPFADWSIVVSMTTDEAFEPIRAMQQRVVVATVLLTLMAGLLTWLLLRRELYPLLEAAHTLGGLAEAGHAPKALAIARNDEVGQLIGNFNQLLAKVVDREARLSESDVLQRGILNSVAAEIAVLDREGVIRVVNEAWLRFSMENSVHSGQPAAGTGLGANYLSICRRSDGTLSQEASEACAGIQAVLAGRQSRYELEYPCHSPQQERWFSMSVTPLEGSPWGGAVVCHSDITQRVQAETLLRTSNVFISKLVDVIPGMVGYWSRDLRCQFANAGYLDWFGKTRQEMDNIALRELLGPDVYGRNERYIRAALNGEAQHFERTLVKADGSVGYTLAHYFPDWHGGQVQGFFAVVSDVTAVKLAQLDLEEANRELQRARDEAQRANQAKSNFLTSMSHELRTPLNSILGFAQIMDHEAGVPAAQREQVREILAAGYHLLQLVKDMLDLAKVEAGVLSVSMEAVDVGTVVRECLHQLASLADANRIAITWDSRATAQVWADRTRLRQVLLNLLSNAIKYNRDGGSVTVTVEPHDEHRLRLVVEDTGAGIAPERLGELFQPFNRLDAHASGVEGTGIGLSLSRRIAGLMGGTVDVSSEAGKGSRFWIELARA